MKIMQINRRIKIRRTIGSFSKINKLTILRLNQTLICSKKLTKYLNQGEIISEKKKKKINTSD